MRLATFNPRSATSTTLLWLAIVACLTLWVPTLIQAYQIPELRVDDPIRSLLQDSLIERASLAEPSIRPPLSDVACQLCTREGTERAWAELAGSPARFGARDPSVIGELGPADDLARARELSLAGWNDPRYLETIGDRAQAERVRVIPASRLHAIGWTLVGVQALVLLLSVPLWRWLRTGARVERETPLSAVEGVHLFTVLMGASAVLYNVSVDWPIGETLRSASPLPDWALLAAILGLACQPTWPRQLLRAFGLVGCDVKQVAGYAVVLLGLMVLGSLSLMLLGDALGYTAPWAHRSSDLFVYGSTAEKWWRALHLVVTGPAFEEVAFTALLFGSLVGRLGLPRAALFTAVVFTAVHAYDLLGSLDILLGSLASCWCYWRSGSLWPCILAHGASNALFAAVVFY